MRDPSDLLRVGKRTRTRKPATYTQRDVERAIKGVLSTGLQVGMVRVDPATGEIVVVPGAPPVVPSSQEANDWDA